MARIKAPKTETGPKHIRPSESEAAEATPELGGTKRGMELPPTGAPMPPFYLAIHPLRWIVMAGQVIPAARTMSLRPGVGGVDSDQAGRPRPSTALAEAEEQGWTVIPWDVQGPGTSYLRRVKATGGWITKWMTLHPGTDEITVDEEGYAAFWAKLIADGQIDPPAPWVLDRMASAIRKSIEDEQKRVGQVESVRLGQLKAQLDAVLAARTSAPKGTAETVEEVPDVG